MFENSKISLNVMPWFKDGFHDRISSIMLAGAACLSDSSGYLDEILAPEPENKEMLIHDISAPESLIPIVQNALADEEGLYEMSVRGRNLANQAMTWKNRVDELLKIL